MFFFPRQYNISSLCIPNYNIIPLSFRNVLKSTTKNTMTFTHILFIGFKTIFRKIFLELLSQGLDRRSTRRIDDYFLTFLVSRLSNHDVTLGRLPVHKRYPDKQLIRRRCIRYTICSFILITNNQTSLTRRKVPCPSCYEKLYYVILSAVVVGFKICFQTYIRLITI